MSDLIIGTDTTTISMEELSEGLPCDLGLMCKSKMQQKASYIFTHKGAEASCTIMFCEPCCLDFQEWLAQCIIRNGPSTFGCHQCHAENMHYTDYIIRPIGG